MPRVRVAWPSFQLLEVPKLTPWHKSDIHGVANEADAMAALRPLKIPPGEYAMPWAGSMQAMGQLVCNRHG